MIKSIRLLAAICAVSGLALPCVATDRMTLLPSQEARKENFQVNKRIQWHNNLDEAKEEAAKNGRLIFWVHMLGSMDGKT